MKKKKVLIGSGIVLILLIASLIGGSLYMLDFSLRPVNRGKDMEGSMAYMRQTYPHIVPWIDSLNQCRALRDTFITAPDGIRMHAFYVRAPRPTAHTAVIVHGYTDNATRMFHIGYLYNRSLGYNILLPDLRYTGLTEGDAIQMGWLDRKDVIQWINTATTMMVSGEKLPDYIRCFVEDCGYTSVWDQFEKELKGVFHLPAFPLLYVTEWICQLQNGWNFHEASALNQVKKCRKPMLFIHGDKDDFVPTWMVYRLYEAKPHPKALWVVPGVDHAHSYRDYPEEYTGKVREFVEGYLEN